MVEHGEESCLELPLIAKERVIGTVELIERRRHACFADDEIELVQSICNVAGAGDRQRRPLPRPRAARARDRTAQRDRAPCGGEPRRPGDRRRGRRRAALPGALRPRRPRAGHRRGRPRRGLRATPAGACRTSWCASPVASEIMERVARRRRRASGACPTTFPTTCRATSVGPLRSALFVRLAAGGRGHRRLRTRRASAPTPSTRVETRAHRRRRDPSRPGAQQRPHVRERQAHAPGQPAGPELRAQRQGLLHARPRRARVGLHGDDGQRARLGRRPRRPGRGGRLPARHRQDRHLRPGPAQAGAAQRPRVGPHAPSPHLRRRHDRAAVRQRAGAAPSATITSATTAAAIPTGSPATTSRSSPARCASPTPTTPCRCDGRTGVLSRTPSPSRSCSAVAASSSIPR